MIGRKAGPPILTLVVGTGYVGRRVVERAAKGTVVGLSRSADPVLPMLERYDLDTGGPLPLELPARYRVLYTVPPAESGEADPRLEALLERLDPPPAAFVYISTTGVYGDRGGARVDESVPVRPETDRARRRVAAETRLAAWSSGHGVRPVVLRAPGIYGPGRLALDRLRAGEPVLREADAGPGNRIHVDDLVRCCMAALGNEEAQGIFNVGDGDHRSAAWFAAEVARQAGLPAPPMISFTEAERQFSPMRMSFLRESRRIDTTRMRRVLGVTPRYANAEDGIRASLAAG